MVRTTLALAVVFYAIHGVITRDLFCSPLIAGDHQSELIVLKVYPEAIHITPGNPSRLLVFRSNPDGSLVDIGSDLKLKVTVADPAVAQVSADHQQIDFRKEGTTAIVVSLGEFRKSIQAD